MTDLLQAAMELQSFCDARGWRSCIIGALAVLRWGEPRATRDVDVTLLTGFGGEAPFIDELLAHFQPRLADAGEFARESRVLLLQASNGVALDVALGAIPFEEECVARASEYEFDVDCRLRVASAEDLIVMKSLAGRGTDWQDAQGILVRQRLSLDWSYVERQLATLAEFFPDHDAAGKLQRLREEISRELS